MNYYLTLSLILFTYMNLWFVVSLIKKRNDVADLAWGLGFVLLSWSSYFLSDTSGVKGLITNLLVSIWGLRLSSHIFSRLRNNSEDSRYLAWRHSWGKWFYLRSYLQVFLLQGLLLYFISLPVLIINRYPAHTLNTPDFVGILVWIFGFLFESISDSQLSSFVANRHNKGKIMQSGLWRYSRHPNYFGEVVQWWGVWTLSAGTPQGFLALVGPLTITVLILKVSGIPLLEERMSQKPGFAQYKQKTSLFVPWFPQK